MGLIAFRRQRIYAAALFIVALCLVPMVCAEARAEGYQAQTQRALMQIVTAEEQVRAGNAAAAQATLSTVGPLLKELAVQAQNFREVANQEGKRCDESVQRMDRLIGELNSQQKDLGKQIDDMNATLARASAEQSLSQAEMDQLNAQMQQVNAGLQARSEKLREVQQWWWVPFYGQYLAIRTLVDQDIETARSLANTIADQRTRLKQQQEVWAKARSIKADFEAKKAQAENTSQQLATMEAQARERMKELRSMAAFLTSAEVFWSKANVIIDTRAASAEDLKLLTSLLGQELTLTDFEEEFTPQAKTLKEALMEFAASLDTKKNFLLDKASEYCGGPERISTTIVSSKCNVSQFTKYYEIVDPVTCSFRYLNPPGCPPPSRTVFVSAEAVAQRKQSGTWDRANDQNWVGRSRCESSDAFYYGKANGADQCEQRCMADSRCSFWTYNERNGYMGMNSIQECWGAAGLTPYKKTWEGFASGGLRN